MALDLKKLGINIRKERKRKNITQEELSSNIGISRNYLSLIETGKRSVTLEILVKIADELECTTDKLLVGNQQFEKAEYEKEIEILLKDCEPTEKGILIDLCESIKKGLFIYKKDIVKSLEKATKEKLKLN